MNKLLLAVLALSISLFACKPSFKPEKSLSEKEQQQIKEELSRYMDKLPSRTSMEERWDDKAKAYYEHKGNQMHMLCYKKEDDGYSYFLITRIVPSINEGDRRASAGRFKMDGNKISDIEEFFLSNILSEEKLNASADAMFEEVLKNKSITKDSPNISLVEWPNDYFAYDKKNHNWDRIEFIKADTTANK